MGTGSEHDYADATGPGPGRRSSAHAHDALRSALGLLRIIEQAPLDDIIQQGLDDAVRLTDSRIGYLHFVNADQATIRLHAWSTGTKRSCTTVEASHYPVARAGIWVDCVHRREPVIHNDYAAEPHRKGLPAGHVTLTRDLGVPVFEDGQIVAVLGVGNKEAAYDGYDVELAQLLANTIWSVVPRKRVHEHLREQLESYLSVRTEARFSHGICPVCAGKEFPGLPI